MKNLVTLSIFFCIILYASPEDIMQKYKYKESNVMFLDNTLREYPKIIGHDTNGFYVLKKDYVNFLEYFNSDLELVKKSEYLKVDAGLKDRHFVDAVFFKDSLYLFYAQVKFKETELYVKTIDKYTLEQNGEERLLATIPHFKGNYPEIAIRLSLLHNKLLIVFKSEALIQKTIKFDFFVFDKGLTENWSKTDFVQYNNHSPREMTYTVDEEGNIHILFLIYEIRLMEHIISDSEMKNEYMVISYLNKGEETVQNSISLDNKFIRGIKLIAGNDGTFICAGFYSEMYLYGIKGAFFVTNNTTTKKIQPVMYSEFSTQMFDNLPDQSKSQRSEEIFSYEIKDLVYRKNGYVVLCGEQRYDQDYNNVNDIIIVTFSSFGQMLWNKAIKKVQTGDVSRSQSGSPSYIGGNYSYASYTLVAPVTEDNIKIIYNENAKNELYNKEGEKLKSFHYSSPSYLVLADVDMYGNITKQKFLSRTKKELIPDPQKTYDMRNGEIIMYANRYRKYKYFRLSLF